MLKGWSGNNFIVPNNIYFGGSLIGSILDGQYQQLKIVAKSGSSYSTITSAQNSITDAASNKIYTVLALPGEYDEALTLKDYVNIVAIDPFNTYILRQVTDNGVPVHCNLKINIDNRQTDGTHGLYLTAASVIHIEGNVKGGNSTGSGGKGIYNYSAGIVKVLNGNVTGGIGGVNGGEGIYNYSTGTVTVINGDVTGGDDTPNSHGIYNYSTGKVTLINGNAIGGKDSGWGGDGIFNYSTGIVTLINSNAIGGRGHYLGGSNYGGRGIYNRSTGKVTVINGDVTGGYGTNETGYGIYNNSGGKVTVLNGRINTLSGFLHPIYGGNVVLENCIIYGSYENVFAIYAPSTKNVKLMNVWSNRALHSNITNLIADGFHVDADVEI